MTYTPPPPCPVCGWQYPQQVLNAAATDDVTLDPNPTHRCEPAPLVDLIAWHERLALELRDDSFNNSQLHAWAAKTARTWLSWRAS